MIVDYKSSIPRFWLITPVCKKKGHPKSQRIRRLFGCPFACSGKLTVLFVVSVVLIVSVVVLVVSVVLLVISVVLVVSVILFVISIIVLIGVHGFHLLTGNSLYCFWKTIRIKGTMI